MMKKTPNIPPRDWTPEQVQAMGHGSILASIRKLRPLDSR